MPIFNYRCSDCSEEFEVLAKQNDNKMECTSCGGKNVKKVYSSFDFKLKQPVSEGNCPPGGCSSGRCGPG
ncbi:MAG: zinc ribbon domain-containing protein [Actinobacteria bacterium]|nr:zinc ribbon domain-containing protein [Actinomycetota bacterium]